MKKVRKHGEQDPKRVRCFVMTVSDTRTSKTDESGRTITEHLRGEGHRLAGYAVVKDDAGQVATSLKKAISDLSPDVAIVNGGTGISKRDSTYAAVERLLERRIPGFGELFRTLSYQSVGPVAMLSRATAGLFKGVVIFVVPGSPKAVRLALNKLILPKLGHVVGEARKER